MSTIKSYMIFIKNKLFWRIEKFRINFSRYTSPLIISRPRNHITTSSVNGGLLIENRLWRG